MVTNEIRKINYYLDPGATTPTRAHEWDAGLDLYAKEDFVVGPCSAVYSPMGFNLQVIVGSGTHDTGVHIDIPKGYVGFLKSKSGLNVRAGLTSDGVIDSGYTGSIVVKLYNHTSQPYFFKKGDKITQLVILPVECQFQLQAVDTFETTERGDNGFGSSGK